MVTFGNISEVVNASVSSSGKFVVITEPGLYLLNYGMLSQSGAPGYCTISFNPGGIDNGGKVLLDAGNMVSGSIIRRIGAGTFLGLHVDSADNNTPVSLPATPKYSNAYLNVARIGPYPATE